jgi:hypothetical protein
MSDQGPRKYAEGCVSRALMASSTFEKTLHLLMADAWLALAHAGERQGDAPVIRPEAVAAVPGEPKAQPAA